MKIKSFECTKSIRNYEKKNTLNVRRLVVESFVPSYYIVDCRTLWDPTSLLPFNGPD